MCMREGVAAGPVGSRVRDSVGGADRTRPGANRAHGHDRMVAPCALDFGGLKLSEHVHWAAPAGCGDNVPGPFHLCAGQCFEVEFTVADACGECLPLGGSEDQDGSVLLLAIT